MTSKIKSYKGFNADLTCRGFQYEVGKEYNHTGAVSACNSGFHACENPMDVLGFYPPCDDNGRPRRYCEVEQSGNIDRGNDKICSSRLRVVAEIGIEGLIKAGVKFIFDKVNWKGAKGCWLVLTERAGDGHILCVKAAEVDGVKIKADTWYKLIDGQFTECND